MSSFFQTQYDQLIDSPNQSRIWWHSIPLPDGNRINGYHPRKDIQLHMWEAFQIPNEGGLAGKKVLDIGANDGFFTLAAFMAGAEEVTSIDKDWETWPNNITYISQVWNVNPKIITEDFRHYNFKTCYDVIFFLGVLYHVEDVFTCLKKLNQLLNDQGVLYLETQMSQIQSDLPIFEYASDHYPTVAPQGKEGLDKVGISNYLFPNEHAMYNLADSYNFHCETLGKNTEYVKFHPTRGVFKLTKVR